jgi:hypothetical protein
MVFAIATLLFQLGAVPAPAATAAKSVTYKRTAPAAVTNLPSAPLPNAAFRLAALDSTNNTQALSTIRIPEPDPKPFRRIGVEDAPSRRSWLALSIVQSGAATFDAYATRQAIANGAHEADPFMRPFANSAGIYAAIQVCPIILDYAARHMQRSENPVVRHSWWLPQALGTGIYIFSGTHDLHVASHH